MSDFADDAALESYLASALSADVTGTEVIADGLNLTVSISTADADDAYVLRRPNELRDTGLFVDVEREYRVLERLRETPVPAPRPVAYCADESVLGAPFFVTEAVEGAPVPLGSDLPERFRTPTARRRLAFGLIDALAELHSLDAGRFEGVCERRSPPEQVDRAVGRLDAVAEATGREFPALRSVGRWLRRNTPADSRTALVHGDFRPGNVLFAGEERPEIACVLDWETAMLGDPLTELGYLLLRWRDEGDPTPSLAPLEARYSDEAIRELAAANDRGLAPFTADPGSPDRRDLIDRYEDRTGIAVERERFYLAHAAFMLAAVWADLHRLRTGAGRESDLEPYVEYVTAMARDIVDGDFRP